MSPVLSVILCSYNPRKNYLDRTLSALRAQTLDKEKWELLLIDNNSDEPLEKRFDLSWHPNARFLIEKRQGLTAARIKGINESKGNLLVFVDDDNLLAEYYLEVAASLSEKFPDVGAFGGSLQPEFEVNPKPELLRYTGKLALRTVHEDKLTNSYIGQDHPYGAGLVIRYNVAKAYVEKIKGGKRASLDRIGSSLGSAGDIDLAFTSIDMGYHNGLFSALSLIHLIPKERVTLEYLAKIRFGINYSGMLLRYYRFNEKPPPPSPLFLQWIKAIYKRIMLDKTAYTMYLSTQKARRKFFDTIKEQSTGHF
jgi:glycosyltransferase involved in cell wall biosynthesis